MINFHLILLLLLIGLGGSSPDPQPVPKPLTPKQNFFLGGIQVNEPDHSRWVDALKYDHMNTVSVTVYAKNGDWDSDNFWYEAEEEAVVHEIRTARAAGLNVVLILRVALDHAYPRNEFFWHGMIMPKNQKLLTSWFNKYQGFVLKWARIASQEQVEVFSIGSEMNALSSTVPINSIPELDKFYLDKTRQKHFRERILKFEKEIQERHLWTPGPNNYQTIREYLNAEQNAQRYWASQHSFHEQTDRLKQLNERRTYINNRWKTIIKETRKIYSGLMTYAANFDNYNEVGFWEDLDMVGINAYFPLRDSQKSYTSPQDMYPDLVTAWEGIFATLEKFREQHKITKKPVMFTELGYTFRKNSTLQPWSSGGFSVLGPYSKEKLMIWKEQPVNFRERELAIEALHATYEKIGKGLLGGILYWKLSSYSRHQQIEPFVLHIGPESNDRLRKALGRFAG